jgi:hypothetical protein
VRLAFVEQHEQQPEHTEDEPEKYEPHSEDLEDVKQRVSGRLLYKRT